MMMMMMITIIIPFKMIMKSGGALTGLICHIDWFAHLIIIQFKFKCCFANFKMIKSGWWRLNRIDLRSCCGFSHKAHLAGQVNFLCFSHRYHNNHHHLHHHQHRHHHLYHHHIYHHHLYHHHINHHHLTTSDASLRACGA